MKVLYIATADYKYGAAKTQIDMILELKNSYGVIPVVLTKVHNPLNDLCDENGIENYSYWYRDIMAGSAYSNPILNLAKHIIKYLLYLRGAITQKGILKCGINWNEIDIIHTNHIRIDIGAYISRKTGIPHIWHIKELNQGHVKIIHYKTRCYQYINKNADLFIAVTNQVKNFWCNAGLESTKVKVIYEGISCDKFIPRKERHDEKLKLVCVGRIEKSKGQLQILQAIEKLPDSIKKNISLDLIGEAYPDYLKQLKKYIEHYGLKDIVTFCGYCENIANELWKYDIGILASKGDAFGTVTAEYMAAGLVPIATYTELVNHMEEGLRYEFNDVDKLAQNIRFLYENAGKREELSARAYEKVRSQYSIEKNAEEICKVYCELSNK